MIDIINEIKQAILGIEPDAEIYLFGSRARGDYQEDSDWDLLILLDGDINYHRKGRIIEALLDTEINHNLTINRIVENKVEWKTDRVLHVTPFFKNVDREAISL
jgi:predicted nucleotidyltransferase